MQARIAGLENQLATKEAMCDRLQTEASTAGIGLRRTREAHVAAEKRVGEVGAQLKTLREQVSRDDLINFHPSEGVTELGRCDRYLWDGKDREAAVWRLTGPK